jgi:ribosome recycling factor
MHPRCTDTKETLRKIQTKGLSRVDASQSEGVNKDLSHAVREVMMVMTEHFAKQADQITLTKQNDIMGK